MSRIIKLEEALDFVREHGIVLVSAKGPVPRLTEYIVGEPIKGSWWAHPQSHAIFAILNAVSDSGQVLICKMIGGKATMIHQRLWPSLVRAAGNFAPEQIAQVVQEHTASGRHLNREITFPLWVPDEVLAQAKKMTEQDALAPFIQWASR